MFDNNLFDRNAYDRSVASGGLSVTIIGNGALRSAMTFKTPVPVNALTSKGELGTKLTLRVLAKPSMTGEGDINPMEMVLRLPLTVSLSGTSNVKPNVAFKTPFKGSLSGNGSLTSKERALQHMSSKITSIGNVNSGINARTAMIFSSNGVGKLNGSMRLLLPLGIKMEGGGSLNLRRIGGLNENIFELSDIDLKPGETVTIDTELLDVLFGYRYDVSSVGVDSVFFQLNPGENEITIATDVQNGPIRVAAIWQNRWL